MRNLSWMADSHGFDAAEVRSQAEREPETFVACCEEQYHAQLDRVVEQVLAQGDRVRILLLAGPSASGKTTTAEKLAENLTRRGKPAKVVSLDNFFLGKGGYPLLEDGTEDYESIYGLNLDLIHRTLREFLETGEADLPEFDFATVVRRDNADHLSLGEDGMLVVEGIHALNPLTIEGLPADCFFRLYVSVGSGYTLEGKELLTPMQMRLMRRMVRDAEFRSYPPHLTLARWDRVLEGERVYIYPYRHLAQIQIDSAHAYEACIFGHSLVPLLKDAPVDQFVSRIGELLTALGQFLTIPGEVVPGDSLLREFIGPKR